MILAAYAACLALLLPKLPLSLDEILDVMALRSHGWGDLMTNIGRNAGGTPLSYLARFPFVHSMGESSAAARLPSALFSVAACYGVFLLARRLKLRWPLLAMIVFAAFPLQFRYALEARAYSQALCLSVWSTVLFLRWMDRNGSPGIGLLYCLSIVAGVYTQAYTLFVPIGHFLWLGRVSRWKALVATGAAIAIAGILFIPWYRFSAPLWRNGVSAVYPESTIDWRAAELIIREIAGTGYFGSAILVCSLFIAFRFGFDHNHGERSFWALYLAIPLLGAIASDMLFVYFLAIRQMIFVLAPLAILFVLGIEASFARGYHIAAMLGVALLGASAYEDVHMFYRPHADYAAAAAILAAEAAENSCLIYVPDESRAYYSFFRPELAARDCKLETAKRVALAMIATDHAKTSGLDQRLRDSGFIERSVRDLQGPRIEVYDRPYRLPPP